MAQLAGASNPLSGVAETTLPQCGHVQGPRTFT